MENPNNKIIVILGPTSSGKSDVAIKLAKKFDGEIISADSRQIYRGMDIGTGKEPGCWNQEKKVYLSNGIPHHMIDIASPRTNFSAAQFKKKADKIIPDILKRGKLPIVCGGTGFWIKSIVDNVTYPEVKPDWELRNKLRDKPKEELFNILRELDPKRTKIIDKNNPVRLIRAIEICKSLGKVPAVSSENKKYQFLQIGINISKENLHSNIKKRLEKRFKQGMIEEVEKLHKKNKLSWKKIQSFGLGYFWIPEYLSGRIGKEELFEKIYQAEKDYAKRQTTWFKKDCRILWLEKYGSIEKEVKNFLSKL
jgi:tRNA dimethylallyltransferase